MRFVLFAGLALAGMATARDYTPAYRMLLNDGAVYQISTGQWTPIGATSSVPGRWGHQAVWINGGMAVWGGSTNPPDLSGYFLDFQSMQWKRMSADNGPVPGMSRMGLFSIGSSLLSLSTGADSPPSAVHGGFFHFDTNSWTRIAPPPPAIDLSNSAVIWTGRQIVAWGGGTYQGHDTTIMNKGITTYDPARNEWAQVSTSNEPEPRYNPNLKFFPPNRMVMWGGFDKESNPLRDGAVYDFDTNSWRTMNDQGAPAPDLDRPTTVQLAGKKLVVWWSPQRQGSMYNLSTNRWEKISDAGAPSAREEESSVAVGSKVVIWGGIHPSAPFVPSYSDGAILDTEDNRWSPMEKENAPTPRSDASIVWDGGDRLVVWGGRG